MDSQHPTSFCFGLTPVFRVLCAPGNQLVQGVVKRLLTRGLGRGGFCVGGVVGVSPGCGVGGGGRREEMGTLRLLLSPSVIGPGPARSRRINVILETNHKDWPAEAAARPAHLSFH